MYKSWHTKIISVLLVVLLLIGATPVYGLTKTNENIALDETATPTIIGTEISELDVNTVLPAIDQSFSESVTINPENNPVSSPMITSVKEIQVIKQESGVLLFMSSDGISVEEQNTIRQMLQTSTSELFIDTDEETTIITAPQVESIESSELISVQNDVCGTAESLNIGTTYTATINPQGDVDWYKYHPTTAGVLTVRVTPPTGKDYDLELYSSCGSNIYCISDNAGSAWEECTMSLAGGYDAFAKVYGYANAYSTSSYTIKGTFESAAPNLIADDIVVSPASPTNGETSYIRIYEKNTGLTTAGSHDIRLYIDGSTAKTCHTNSLPSGASAYCDYDSTNLAAGSHQLKLVVDISSQVSESSESDNQRTETHSWQQGAEPDLVSYNLYTNPDSFAVGQTVELYMAVGNEGTAAVSNTFTNKLYIDGTEEYSWTKDSLSVNQYSFNIISLTLFVAKQYEVKMQVDANSNIAESNENNNVRTIYKTPNTPIPDLVSSNIWTEPSSPTQGESVAIKMQYGNGVYGSIAPHTTKLYIDNQLKNTFNLDTLAIGQDWILTYTTSSITAGSHAIKFVIDSNNDISETNEGNNEPTLTKTWAAPAEPDLIVTSIGLTPSSPAGGQSAEIKFWIKNNGGADASQTFYTRMLIDGSEVYRWYTSGGLDTGFSVFGTYSAALSCGTHTIRMETDIYDVVNEYDETNNYLTSTPNWACNACSGEIQNEVTDGAGTALSGIKIYQDGALQGTTSAQGTYTTFTSDPSCGQSHTIATYCDDNVFCASADTKINYNNDVDQLYFSCPQCAQNQNSLDLIASSQATYCKGDTVRVDLAIRDNSNNLVSNTLLGVYDELLAQSNQFSLPTGLAYYETPADKTGYYELSFSSSKTGYVPDSETIGVMVEYCLGSINVDVDDLSGSPIPNAKVYMDSNFQGLTDTTGRKLVSAGNFQTHSVEVRCPNDNECATKNKYVNGNTLLNFDCDCSEPIGDLSLQLITDETEYIVSNVYVWLDGETTEQITTPAGYVHLDDLEYGTHTFDFYVYVSKTNDVNDEETELRHARATIVVDKPDENIRIWVDESSLEFTGLDMPLTDELFVSSADNLQFYINENVDPQFVCGGICIAVAVITVAAIIYDSNEVYECDKKVKEQDTDWVDECWDEVAWLGTNFIPVGAIYKSATRGVVWAAKGVRFLPKAGTYAKAASKIVGLKNSQAYGFKYGGKLVDAIASFADDGTKTLRITKNAGAILVRNSDDIAKGAKLTVNPVSKTVKIGDTAVDVAKFGKDKGNNIGQLGEMAADQYIDDVIRLADKDIKIIVNSGTSGSEVIKNGYKFKYLADGKNIEFVRLADNVVGELDRVVQINSKTVVLEAKAGEYGGKSFAPKITEAAITAKKAAATALTGEASEFVLIAPKDAIAKGLAKPNSNLNKMIAKGGKYVKFTDSVNQFEYAARILAEAVS